MVMKSGRVWGLRSHLKRQDKDNVKHRCVQKRGGCNSRREEGKRRSRGLGSFIQEGSDNSIKRARIQDRSLNRARIIYSRGLGSVTQEGSNKSLKRARTSSVEEVASLRQQRCSMVWP